LHDAKKFTERKTGCKIHHTETYLCLKPDETHSPGSITPTQRMKPEAEADNPSADSII